VAKATRRLKPDQRDRVFAEITELLGANAAAQKAEKTQTPSEGA
jgi:hypothetical protein